MRPILADAFEHHVWATLRLIDVCTPLPSAQLMAPIPGAYGSILDTLRHLVGADRSYLALLSGGRVAALETDELDLAGMRRVMTEDGETWRWLLAQDLDPDTVVVRHRDDGSEVHAPLGIRLAQVIHHGTDHRSQVCSGLTVLGIEPPAIDVWDFAEQSGRLRELPARPRATS